MNKIDLQRRTKAKAGRIELFWFENENIGLAKTLFHRIYIPLDSFNSGLDYETQPVETQIVIDWLKLNFDEPTKLDGVTCSSTPEDEVEVSIYLGDAHIPCDIRQMKFRLIADNRYEVDCALFIEFEYEGIAENEIFNFTTELELDPLIKE